MDNSNSSTDNINAISLDCCIVMFHKSNANSIDKFNSTNSTDNISINSMTDANSPNNNHYALAVVTNNPAPAP